MQISPELSSRAKALQPSLTLAISARSKALQKRGVDICSLSAGEPDFNTPEFIIEATLKALKDGVTRYGPSAGDPELRHAIAEKLTSRNNIETTLDEVLVTNGGKQAIYNLFQILLNPGDEVLIPSPYWLSYPEMARLAGGVPIPIKSDPNDGFKLDIEALNNSINEKSRLLVLNTPGNPTGQILSLDLLKNIVDLVQNNPNLCVMSDEIYEFLLEENTTHYSFAALAPEIKDRIFTVNGFAKGWAMTGWRIGYLCGNKDTIKAASALQSQSTSNVCSFVQKGALAALTGPMDCVYEMVDSYNKRRKQLTKGLLSIKGIALVPPKGAFYAFPQLPEGCPDSITFCEKALEESGLALVPGAAFGEDRCIRLSCAVSQKTIEDGLNRLDNFIMGILNKG
ncbi:pyridoxal phosphate-dependent aminotransferase [Prochlorococcus sp. MIT 1300]|uniref:pyridoxal phosphate-dependent aminotransferase n=1 Tax=Prochlorococcus sp. MIT 1300 TaxID=3096218 RepID=UPI002A75034A|nr:pyridoxal phosphate-dependent aminotransferase [Prochlorococcus sp. MIT 1300]